MKPLPGDLLRGWGPLPDGLRGVCSPVRADEKWEVNRKSDVKREIRLFRSRCGYVARACCVNVQTKRFLF